MVGRCSWLLLWLAVAPLGAQDFRAQALELRQAGKPVEALALIDQAFRGQLAVATAASLIALADQIAYQDVPAPQRFEYYQRVFEQQVDRPAYYLFGATLYVESLALMGERSQPDRGVTVADQALAATASLQPADQYYLQRLRLAKLLCLAKTKRLDEARAYGGQLVETWPVLLGNRNWHRALAEYAAAVGTPEALVGAARSIYLTADYTDTEVREALRRVNAALAATGGPGVALQFARAQEDLTVANPLRAHPPLLLGDPDRMLAAAGEQYGARMVVLLQLGRVTEALAAAKQQMSRSAAEPANLAQALKDLARCFRAQDLSLLRANAFLEFHRTGEGDNPLPALEKELAAAAAAQP
ncbi:MAG: hypothetical protein IT204_07520 [Fimbriimonadaceae bacterium]|nr:hypothetical protein [Fimbriimonadaceae bacterium]